MRISLIEAAKRLSYGEVIGIPTETVYGLGGSLYHPEAIDKIFTLKGRPSNNPLIIHVSQKKQISDFVPFFPPGFDGLSEAFWPGPLTLVMEVDTEKVPFRARAGLPTAAFRIPRHPLTLDLLDRCGPLVMPSANLSGKPSATKPPHIEADFGIQFPILDGGSCQKGLESTIAIYHQDRWEIIRLGSIAPEEFIPVLHYLPLVNIYSPAPLCPGQLYRHYAPKAQLILGIPENPQGSIVGFSDREYPFSARVFPLGFLTHPESVAENLYAVLRQLDEEMIQTAYVDMNFPREGLWATLFERLTKAANENKTMD